MDKKQRQSRAPLRALANRYASRAWVPDNPTRRKIDSLMYYSYIAGYNRRRRESKNA